MTEKLLIKNNNIKIGYISFDTICPYLLMERLSSEDYNTVRKLEDNGNMLHVYNFTLDSQYRGKGLFSVVMGLLKKYAIENGYECITLVPFPVECEDEEEINKVVGILFDKYCKLGYRTLLEFKDYRYSRNDKLLPFMILDFHSKRELNKDVGATPTISTDVFSI